MFSDQSNNDIFGQKCHENQQDFQVDRQPLEPTCIRPKQNPSQGGGNPETRKVRRSEKLTKVRIEGVV